MSPPQNSPVPEFRPYRRFVSLFVLVFITLGSGYLLTSVGVTIYRQRNAVPKGAPVSAAMTPGEMRGCFDELMDVTLALEKHLEKSHYLLGGYDQGEAQRWAAEGDIWRNQWKALGARCRLSKPRVTEGPRDIEELGAAYVELSDIETVYTRELLRFGKEQAPRLDRLRKRLGRIGARLEAGQRAGDQTK